MITGSVLLGRAVLGYFTHVRSALKLAQDLREYSREDLIRDLDFLYRKSALPFKHQFALGLVGVYGIGLAEIDLSLSNPTLDKLADHYAGQFMDYIHTTAVRDAADAYTAMINRGTPRKMAAERVKKFFGTTARGFTTMINQWSKKPEKSTGSRTIREDLRDDTALKVAAKDLLNRIASIQDSESWHAKESIKNTAWRIAVDKKMLPKTAEKEWITADDELVCRVCGPLHHKRVLVGEPFKLSDGRELWAPGVHPNCFVAGTLVSAVNVKGASARVFKGEVVVVRTASGKELTATPNHPILTDRGWVPAGLLNIGIKVVSATGEQREPAVDQDDHYAPAMIEDVAETILSSGSRPAVEVPVSPEHFHGDGGGSEVAVVGSDVLLGDHLGVEHVDQGDLDGGHAELAVLPGRSYGLSMFPGLTLSSDGVVRGRGTDASFGLAHLGHADSVGLTSAPRLHTSLQKPCPDSAPGGGQGLRNALLALPGQVTLDDVVNVELKPFHGYVYNLESDLGWYIANGIVTHNCRCELKIRVRISLKPAQLVSKSRDNSDIRRLPDGTFAPSGQGQVRYAQDRPRTVRVAEREQLGSEFDQLKDVERLAAEPAARQWDNPWAEKTEDLWSKKAANPWSSEDLFSGKTENPWAIKENPVSTEGPAFSAKENPFDNKKDLFDTKANPFDVSRKFSWIQPRENPFTGSKDHYNTWFSGTGSIIEGEVEEVEQTNLQKLEQPVYAVFDYYMINPEFDGEYLDPDVRDERVKWVASMRFTSNPYKVRDDMIDMIASGENHEHLVDGYDQQYFTVSAHQLGGNLKTALEDDYDPDREYRIPEETFSAMVWYSLISLAYETVGDTNRLEIYEREMSNPSSEDNWGDIIDYGDFNMEDDAIRDRAMIADLAKKTGLYNEIVDAYNEGYLMSPGVAMIDEVDPNYDDIHGGYEEMEMIPRTEINPDSFLDFPMGDPDVWEGSVVPMYKLDHFKMDSEGRL